jgi:hypothetical protein
MLILLIGPKGSGKSHIGRLLDAHCGIHFFPVERHWMAYHADCRRTGHSAAIEGGIERIHPGIEAAIDQYGSVSVETTGASEEILDDLLRIGSEYGQRLVRIRAPYSVCLERISARNAKDHLTVDPETVRKAYDLSEAVQLPFDVDLENVALSDQQILDVFSGAGICSKRPDLA